MYYIIFLGLPTKWEHGERVIFDSIRLILSQNIPRTKLVSAIASTWESSTKYIYSMHIICYIYLIFLNLYFFVYIGKNILISISKKLSSEDLEIYDLKHSNKLSNKNYNRFGYYEKFGNAKYGLALPGIGFDCYRLNLILIILSLLSFNRKS